MSSRIFVAGFRQAFQHLIPEQFLDAMDVRALRPVFSKTRETSDLDGAGLEEMPAIIDGELE
ncbi:hypothetical protein SHL15_7890 [Streptomyces hygroscopicus subsp. limoneus]|nr:hypothetical protein SHL15_7890 [Streptomyces hygroscopicus subsp. limoneus]